MEEKENKMDKVKEQVEEKINNIMTQGIKPENIDNLYKLVDIHKDLANEEYWKIKEGGNEMRYRYGNYTNEYGRESYGEDMYSGGRIRDSRGRYMERGGSGRRGNYRGHDMLDNMYENYGEYSESREEYKRGNYGAKGDTMKSLEYMLESVVDFMEMLKEDASSKEEVDLIKKYSKKISEM